MKKKWPELAKLAVKIRDIDGHEHTLSAREWAANQFRDTFDGEQKYFWFIRYLFLTWPEFIDDLAVNPNGTITFKPSNKWNPWLERHIRAFTNSTHAVREGETIVRTIGLTGCGGAGKTFAAGTYAVPWWAADPENSIAILTSTTVGMIGHRIWPIITGYHANAYDTVTGRRIEFGHMIDSMKELRVRKENPKNAVFALAVAQGETQKAIHNLKGMHAKRILLIVDEANGTPEAIFETIPNLMKGAQDITVIVIGNPWSRMDPHGRAITPEDGWGVFNEDLLEWRSKGVPEWQLEPGVVLRFDGKHSPNVVRRRNDYPYIYTFDNWQKDNHPLVVGTPNYWTQCRGMHPPEGMSNTIFNEQLFERCDADGIFTFYKERVRLGFLDPAFGGDACKLMYGEMGDVDGKMCLMLTDSLDVPIDPNAMSQDIDYQIARRVMEENRKRQVSPKHFGLDATGIGRGVGAILSAEWSPEVHYMSWGAGATERASAQHDGRPAREVYNNFVCELWFAVREALESGQMKGFSRECKAQLAARTYEMNGKKYKIEPKPDMKERVRYSPDAADCAAGILEVARRNGLMIQGRMAEVKESSWLKEVKEAEKESPLEFEFQFESIGGWAEEEFR